MNLYSDNLILRPFELDDAQRVRELAGDYEIAKTTLNIPHPYPEGAAEAFINRSHEVAKEGTHYDFAIVRKHDNALVGAIALGITSRYKRAEMAYWTGSPYWGKGYMTEAASRLVKFGFEELDLNRIYAFAFTSNPASSKVMRKIGMNYEGTLVQHVLKWDQYYDLDAYGILRQTYHELEREDTCSDRT
ncbi:GNAT family N-acetyltransferase [Sulfoacidibacillus ferrooxidans]|uniref:GNAT family N-acetyltransferase n=1 Tax=Sulfoacidibacillus ferrooxidans TaxID=2005001 RepID=UPI0030156F43